MVGQYTDEPAWRNISGPRGGLSDRGRALSYSDGFWPAGNGPECRSRPSGPLSRGCAAHESDGALGRTVRSRGSDRTPWQFDRQPARKRLLFGVGLYGGAGRVARRASSDRNTPLG